MEDLLLKIYGLSSVHKKAGRSFFIHGRPMGGLLPIEDLQKTFIYKRPAKGLLCMEDMWKFFFQQKPCRLFSTRIRSVEDLLSTENMWNLLEDQCPSYPGKTLWGFIHKYPTILLLQFYFSFPNHKHPSTPHLQLLTIL